MTILSFEKKNLGWILEHPHEADWFTAQLLRLIAKADRFNRQRIRQGFPEEVAAFEEWERKPPKP